MTRFEALVSLNLIGNIGSTRLKKLLDYFGKPENILRASPEKLSAIFGIGEEITRAITCFKKEDLDRELTLAKSLGIKIITREDEDYPENLKNIFDPPIVLYLKGKLIPEDKNSIAIVGSRRASVYGLNCAEKFACELSNYGFTIISGMARGIDTYAHRGALKAKGRTIAVMGSGFNHIYPEENKELSERIAKCGTVISEFPMNTEPLKQNFPRRNRIISGLSLGVLVVEAARNSGALITADCALEQGREVFALPGKVDSGTSFGTNSLIQQGAKLIANVADIIEELIIPVANIQKEDGKVKKSENSHFENEDEYRLYELISDESVQLDDLVDKTNIDAKKISDILLRLQLKHLIKQLPGKQFVRS